MQPQSQMEEMGYNDLIYGWDLNHFVPTFMNPNEILDGLNLRKLYAMFIKMVNL